MEHNDTDTIAGAELFHSPEIDKPRVAIEMGSSSLTADAELAPDHTRNEDAILQDESLGLIGVFDGVGSSQNGHESAEISVDSFLEHFRNQNQAVTFEEAVDQFEAAFPQANKAILERNQTGSQTAAAVVKMWKGPDDSVRPILASFGDCRVYFLPVSGGLFQLTTDNVDANTREEVARDLHRAQQQGNNYVEEQTYEEQQYFKTRNQVDHVLGSQRQISPRVLALPALDPGDRLLVTGDGVHDNLTSDEIEAVAAQCTSAQQLTEELTKAAYARSRDIGHQRHKPDDISAAAIYCR